MLCAGSRHATASKQKSGSRAHRGNGERAMLDDPMDILADIPMASNVANSIKITASK